MRRLIYIITVFLLAANLSMAQNDGIKPKWLRQVPQTGVDDVRFILVRTSGVYGMNMNANPLGQLAVNLPGEWNVSTKTESMQVSEHVRSRSSSTGQMRQVGSVEVEAEGKPVTIPCMQVAEYTGKTMGNNYDHWVLYQVTRSMDVPFLDYYKTSSYGAQGALLSIIPGCGQFHKGEPLKGVLFLGGVAAGAGLALFSETQRQAYISQIGQTHDINVIKSLDAKQKNLGIVRNIGISASVAIYIWNLIDAATAPGAERIVLTGNALQFKF